MEKHLFVAREQIEVFLLKDFAFLSAVVVLLYF